MITGPVVGIVAQASVKILLEVSLATEVTLNVFLLSDVSNEGRFLIKKVAMLLLCTSIVSVLM